MVCCNYGLSATVGWDATTGLGTPNFVTYGSFNQAMKFQLTFM